MAAKKKAAIAVSEEVPVSDVASAEAKPAKKPYELAIEEFEKAETAALDLMKRIESGDLLVEIMDRCKGDKEKAKEEWSAVMTKQRDLIEEHNVRRKNAADLLRQEVSLPITQQRGPDGSPTVISCGKFKVTSATSRWLDSSSLFEMTKQRGLFERLLELKSVNKEGIEYHLVQQKWEIDYEKILSWLRANKLGDVVQAAYDEKEKTPMVSGPKEMYYLGDRKKD